MAGFLRSGHIFCLQMVWQSFYIQLPPSSAQTQNARMSTTKQHAGPRARGKSP